MQGKQEMDIKKDRWSSMGELGTCLVVLQVGGVGV